MNHTNFIENTVRKKIILQNIQCNISNKGKNTLPLLFTKNSTWLRRQVFSFSFVTQQSIHNWEHYKTYFWMT